MQCAAESSVLGFPCRTCFCGKFQVHVFEPGSLGCVHTGGERFFGVNGDVTSYGRLTP